MRCVVLREALRGLQEARVGKGGLLGEGLALACSEELWVAQPRACNGVGGRVLDGVEAQDGVGLVLEWRL